MAETRKGRSVGSEYDYAEPAELDGMPPRDIPQRQTSITAAIVTMGTVTMSMTELRLVTEILNRATGLTGNEGVVVREFTIAVEAIAF